MKTTAKKDAVKILMALKDKGLKDLYTFGNGGSCAIANHMAVDWTKNSGFTWNVISLCSNTAMLTMIANDYGYESVCAKQIQSAISNSALILISSSGKSRNIVVAAQVAKMHGMLLIGFTGFGGGQLKQLCDVSVHIDSKDYEEAEDYHNRVMHEVSRLLRGDK